MSPQPYSMLHALHALHRHYCSFLPRETWGAQAEAPCWGMSSSFSGSPNVVCPSNTGVWLQVWAADGTLVGSYTLVVKQHL